jgi:outer membrane protein insertion porin family
LGNRVIRDYVIRRQFKSAEGDPFNPSEVRSSAARIRALGIFGDVNVSTRASDKVSSVVVDVEVEEQPTGSFGIGFTYSNDEGPGGTLKLTEKNFLGRGQFLSFNLTSLSDANQVHISFSEPQFLNRDLALGLKLGSKTTSEQFSKYDSEVTEFEPSLSFPLSQRSTLKLKYRFSDENLTSKSTSLSSAISSQMGSRKINTLGYVYDLDSRVDTIDPNENLSLTFSQDYSIEDANFSYIKTKALLRRHKMVFREEVGISTTFEFGHLSQVEGKSRVVDRFKTFTRQMRGFKGGGIGPRDRHSTNQDPLGGKYFAVARLESEFPLMVPEEYKVRGAIFLDAGSVWGLDDKGGTSGASQLGGIVDDKFYLRSTIGAGLLWGTPIGPLRFDFTKAIKKLSYDKPESFNFSISTKF